MMRTRSYTAPMRGTLSRITLAREVRASDRADYGVDLKANRKAILDDAVAASGDPDRLLNFNRFRMGKKDAYSYSDYGTVLVLRAISTIVRRRFRLKMPDRGSIVRGVIQGLGDATPFCVVRRDIASFYESIATSALKAELLSRSTLSTKVHRYLERFFDIHCKTPTGLPRGISLSAVLAERAMQEYDAAVWSTPGVIRYYRFADDILVFSIGAMHDVCQAVEDALPTGLSYSPSKYIDVHYDATKSGKKVRKHFDYLGYRFTADAGKFERSRPRHVSVSISEVKINRAKSRLLVSAKELLRTGGGSLFLKRLQFLTGNHRVRRVNPLVTTGQKSVKAGVYYNYRYCGEYKNGEFLPPSGTELKSLDWFLFNAILNPRSPFGFQILASMTPPQRAAALRVSFYKGHHLAYQTRFKSQDVKEIRKVWRNV
jgi:hypothetical protein